MKRLVFRPNRSIFGMLVIASAVAVLVGCSQELVFDNEYDPQAENSPLSISITGVYSYAYMDETTGKTVVFGWDRVGRALSYQYEIAHMYNRENAEEAFRRVASGERELVAGGPVGQPIEGNDPFDRLPAEDGEYAIRVRYLATATNDGVTRDVWSPWSSPEQRRAGVPIYNYPTSFLERGEWFSSSLIFRGDRFIFFVDAVGSGAAGTDVYLSVRDEFSGYPNGADVEISVYDADNSFDGPFIADAFMYDKEVQPVRFLMPTSERLYIMFESYNDGDTDFEIRIDY